MKKTLYIFFLMICTLHFAQGTANPFQEGEKENSAFDSSLPHENELKPPDQSSGGNPADPAPINDYIPLLVISAVGIIIYSTYKKKNLRSKTNNQ